MLYGGRSVQRAQDQEVTRRALPGSFTEGPPCVPAEANRKVVAGTFPALVLYALAEPMRRTCLAGGP